MDTFKISSISNHTKFQHCIKNFTAVLQLILALEEPLLAKMADHKHEADGDKHDHHHTVDHTGHQDCEGGSNDCSDAPPFTEDDLASKTDPYPQLKAWAEEGKDEEYLFTTLSTVSDDGIPSSRYVGLSVTDSGIRFMTNQKSNKAREFDSNPNACALFYWPLLDRQVIIKGRVEKLPRDEFLAMYKHVPTRECQITLNMGDQDEVLSDYAELQERREQTEEKYKGVESLPPPESFQCYALKLNYCEFYQGHHNWQADRIVFTQEPGGESWALKRFLP